MNKKILASIFVIGILALAMGWGTYSFFSDTEKSTGNVFTAGTIDIAVDNQNPWTATYSAELSDVKPSENRWIKFVITNPGKNPVNVWKHIKVIECSGGMKVYPTNNPVASSEPEYEEGLVNNVYVERCWLPPYILYDLSTSIRGDIVTQTQQIRVDNINCMWIYLGQIPATGSMTVWQSYHLSSWKDALELDVTNWAQGDTMTFDIELYAEQVGGVGPIGKTATLHMENKNPTTWEVIADGTYGDLTYDTTTGAFTFSGKVKASTAYELIYYADPWPGNNPGALLGSGTSDSSNAITITGTLPSIPQVGDKNYPVGGKIWLVLDTDYDGTKMVAWNPTEYLFEMHLITYP
jgi:predicted ribosomally synthesized peptide with SipW-like signal peptide